MDKSIVIVEITFASHSRLSESYHEILSIQSNKLLLFSLQEDGFAQEEFLVKYKN